MLPGFNTMFTDLLFDQEEVSFKPNNHNLSSIYAYEVKSGARWVNKDNDLMLIKNEKNKWSVNCKHSMMRLYFNGRFYKTKTEAVDNIQYMMEKLNLDLNLDFNIVRNYSFSPSVYTQNLKFKTSAGDLTSNGIIMGNAGNWHWTIPELETYKDILILSGDTPQIKKIGNTFKSKTSLYNCLWNIVAHNLPTLYNNIDYSYPLNTSQPLTPSCWWFPFIKTEVNLHEIFS